MTWFGLSATLAIGFMAWKAILLINELRKARHQKTEAERHLESLSPRP